MSVAHSEPGAWQAHAATLKAAAMLRATRPANVASANAARLILLDTIGCMLAARTAPEVRAFEQNASAIESGPFTFPGGRRLSLTAAAQVGAMAATWDEACEGHAHAHGRPGVAAVAALLREALPHARIIPAHPVAGTDKSGPDSGKRSRLITLKRKHSLANNLVARREKRYVRVMN